MKTLIKYSQLTKTPWKNGQGVTTQILIHPPEAQFPQDFFEWRLSCAEVRSSNQFSQFPGYDRLLLVWQGEGLRLNGKNLEPLKPIQFAGEESIQCDLVKGAVIDLGLIYKRHRYNCSMEVFSLKANQEYNFTVGEGHHLIFSLTDLEIGNEALAKGDVLDLREPQKLKIHPKQESGFIQIKISYIQNNSASQMKK